MYGTISQDIQDWIEDRYKIRPISQEDELQRRLQNIVQRLHDHIASAPPPIVPPAQVKK
jgi:hypothetical protein